jgi:hypothetical protein
MDVKLLIVVRVGAASLHRIWTAVCANAVDVAVSVFDDSAIDTSGFVAVHRAKGSKFGGLQAFFAENPGIIDAYTHFWLFDDDLYLPIESVLTIKDVLARYDFPLCSPSLAPESFVSWPIMVRNEAFHLRATNWVEVMAPIMSRAFLRRALPLFGETHGGWGYEWLWQNFLYEMRACAAIVDSAPVVHTRPVGGGSLYRAAGGAVVDPAAEMNALFDKYGIGGESSLVRNYFALDRTDHRPLVGAAFLTRALEGYPLLRRRHPPLYDACMAFLRGGPPALATIDALLQFAGAAAFLPSRSAMTA